MALLNIFSTSSETGVGSRLVATALVILAYPLCKVIYNVYFHPLAKYPGPKLWAASRLPYMSAMLQGNLVKRELEFHAKYGPVCRIAPNEISFTKEEAWNDIYGHKAGGRELIGKDPLWYQSPDGAPANIILTTDPIAHARMRNLLKNSFSDSTLRQQQPLINKYADLFINQLRSKATNPVNKGVGASINIVDWFTYFTTDIIGDLALGESFHCLDEGQYHEWVQTLYRFFQDMNMAVAPRFYPLLDTLVQKMIPRQILDSVKAHNDFIGTKLNARLNVETSRPDFVTALMKDNAEYQNMSLGELQSSMMHIIVAGSETTATTLCGVINYLIRPEYSPVFDKLVVEIRGTYKREADITIDSLVNLPYLTAVLQEGLRLCNPVPGGLFRRVGNEPVVVAGCALPAGTALAIRPWCMARDPNLFAEPTRFAPERWLSAGKRPKNYAFDHLQSSQPFSVGSYNCLGQGLAWVEMRLALARLLWAFDVSEEPGKGLDWDDQDMIVMIHKKPFEVKIGAREGVEIKGE